MLAAAKLMGLVQALIAGAGAGDMAVWDTMMERDALLLLTIVVVGMGADASGGFEIYI